MNPTILIATLAAVAATTSVTRAAFVYHDTATTTGGTFNATNFPLSNLKNAGHDSPLDTESTVATNASYATANPPTGGYPVTITLNFNEAVDLSKFYLWNHSNNNAGETRGIKDFTLTFFDAADAQIGAVFSSPVGGAAQAPSADNVTYAAEVFSFASTYSGVRSVDLIVTSSHTDSTGFFAIRELGFEAIPEPSSALLAGLGALALFRRRR